MLHGGLRYAFLAVLPLLTAHAGIFSGGAVGSAPIYVGVSNFFTWDTSNLSLVDTADGMRFSGSLAGTLPEGFTFGGVIGGTITLMAWREISVPTGTELNVRAELTSTTHSSSPEIVVTSLANYGRLSPSSSETTQYCFVGDALFGVPEGIGSVGSPASIPSSSNSCATTSSPVYLGLRTDIQFVYEGLGTAAELTIDFGNSAIAEATLVDQVPEPGTILLLAAGLGLVGIRRRVRY